jgi:hypothetical protein
MGPNSGEQQRLEALVAAKQSELCVYKAQSSRHSCAVDSLQQQLDALELCMYNLKRALLTNVTHANKHLVVAAEQCEKTSEDNVEQLQVFEELLMRMEHQVHRRQYGRVPLAQSSPCSSDGTVTVESSSLSTKTESIRLNPVSLRTIAQSSEPANN